MKDPNDAILMTESGHRIGEVVLADNTSVLPLPDSELIEANREQLLRSQASEMTGALDPDTAIAELYPGYGDTDKRKKAMNLFVLDGRTVDSVAKEVGVPGRTVSMWAYNGQWTELVKRELAVRQSQSVLELARLRADCRTSIMKEQLQQAKELRDAAMNKMRSDETSIKSATEAWAAASKIEHTVAGLSEAGEVASVDQEQGSQKKPDGKQPLVVVFNNGSAAGIPTLGGRK